MKDLLLLLCKYPFDSRYRDTLSRLIKEVQSWNILVKLINDHGIIALATYNLKESGLNVEIPVDAMAFLENGYRISLVRNTWLTVCWKEVNDILSNAGIKHILLKGMALEHTVYGARGLRQMNDHDILISREDAITAWHLLQKYGFVIKTQKSKLHLKIMQDISQHLPTLYKNGYALEIHNRLYDYNTTEELSQMNYFENPVEISVSDKKALILNIEDNLKYLIKHFEWHKESGECQLRLYEDILLLDNKNIIEFPEQFILNPLQGKKPEFHKAVFRANLRYIHPKYRLLFILGELFPSIDWMKERYNCTGFKAIFKYPHRFGKLLWLFGT